MADKAAPKFTITGQFPDAGPNAAGQYVGGVTVTFRTDFGTTGQVFVPQAEFNAATVGDKIRTLVAEQAAVHSLTE